MNALITRNGITESRKIISSELTLLQKTFYDGDMLNYCDSEVETQEYLDRFDVLEKSITNIETFNSNKIFGLNHQNIVTFTSTLSEKLIELFKIVDAKEFYIISHLKLDFFGNRDNKFKPLVKAYQKLESIVGRDSYKEAFITDIASLPVFIEILFWITRCDPSTAEYIFLFDKDERFQIHLCKHGNLHLTEYKNETFSDKLLTKLGWTIIEGEEFDSFSASGKIKGRQLKI